MLIMNIGLRRNNGTSLTYEAVCGILMRRFGAAYIETAVSDTEPTLIVCLPGARISDLRLVIEFLSKLLFQDCIACTDSTGRSELLGPRAAAWGKFDSSKFLFPTRKVH